SKSNTIAYIGLLQLIIIFLFSRWKRLVLFVLTVLLFITLHIIEYYYPSFIKIYSPEIIFFDRLIQLPIIFCLSFAILLAFVKEYNRTNNKYYQLANYDELTGLYNRRKFDFVVHNTLNENVEHTCLVLFDLDNFKRVNDNLGHRKGDEVLKEFSSILTKNVDFNEHIICRWGGDEFAIIYYGDKEELEIIINSIKKQFHSYAYKVNDDLKVSGSIVVLEEYDSYEEALNAVDGLLYSEKYIKKSITKE
ncbi:MAG: GGDEF domain-containing protein, partial [Acholeplasma sp.]|nr:GGDEF domain-containing protein [Acholeplasma sp.]